MIFISSVHIIIPFINVIDYWNVKYLLIILFSSLAYFCNAQNKQPLACTLLQKAIETDAFYEELDLNKNPDTVLYITDTAGYFNDCSLSKIHGIKIKFMRILTYTKKGEKILNNHNVIIYRVDRDGSEITLYFVRPFWGGIPGCMVGVRLKCKNGGVDVIGYIKADR